MTARNLQNLTALGAGVLGGQIAWHSAFKGKTVTLYDPFPEALERGRLTLDLYAGMYALELGAGAAEIAATRARLSYTAELGAAVAGADLVIEAVPEIPEIKATVYRAMAPLMPAHTLVATNSSTLLPRDFAEATGRPAQFCALHFANRVWRMNVVKVMGHAGTAPATLEAVTAFAVEIGQVPVRKQQNGYVLNTWCAALLTAAQILVSNGVAAPEDVDRTYMIAHPAFLAVPEAAAVPEIARLAQLASESQTAA